MATLCVRDVMSKDVVTVRPDAPVSEVVTLLCAHRIGGMPVVDEEGRVLGMVTESDLMIRVSGPHVPAHIELLGSVIYLESPHDMKEHLRKALGATARDLMSSDPVVVSEDMTVRDVADLMVTRHCARLPVMREGRLVGILTRHDILSSLQ